MTHPPWIADQTNGNTPAPVGDHPLHLTRGPPEIAAPAKLKEFASGTGSRIVLAESENNTRLRDALQPCPSDVTLAIGPEGGWTADELQWFRDSGWTAASLGDTILRAETAAIVATALALDALR